MRRFIRAFLWLLAALYIGLVLLMMIAPNGGGDDVLFATVVVPAMITAYFLPTIVAFRNGHPYRTMILVGNICLAETGIGWILLLTIALSCGKSSQPKSTLS